MSKLLFICKAVLSSYETAYEFDWPLPLLGLCQHSPGDPHLLVAVMKLLWCEP